MRKAIFAAVAALSLSMSANAGVLQHNGVSSEIEGVEISTTAKASVDGRDYELATVGAGLRKKKVSILKVKVYVGQLLVSDQASFVRDLDGALDSLDSMKAVAMRMTFLRSVEVEKLVDAYQKGMEANGVDFSQGEGAAFLQAVEKGGDAAGGEDMVVVGEKLEDGTEIVTYQNSEGQTESIVGPKGFVKAILSLWIGETIEQETEKLKADLIMGNGL